MGDFNDLKSLVGLAFFWASGLLYQLAKWSLVPINGIKSTPSNSSLKIKLQKPYVLWSQLWKVSGLLASVIYL